MSIVMSEDKQPAPFEPASYRDAMASIQAAREAEASEFLMDHDPTDNAGMEMLGRLIAIAVVFAVVGCVWAVML